MAQAPVQERSRQPEKAVARRARDDSSALAGPVATRRAWDLRPGDHFHGRTIAAVHGVVGLGSNPVAVISFTGGDTEHHGRALVGATRADTDRGHDTLRPLVRNWVREHGLVEGQVVDLDRLRSDVLTTIAADGASGTTGQSHAASAGAAGISCPR